MGKLRIWKRNPHNSGDKAFDNRVSIGYACSMSKLQRICAESSRLGETRDCAVKAVSLALRKPYKDIHARMRQLGRKRKKGTPNRITRQVIDDLGYWLDDCSRYYMKKAKTIRTLERVLPKKGTFLVWTNGHLLCAKNGEILDWTQNRLHRIKQIKRGKKRLSMGDHGVAANDIL